VSLLYPIIRIAASDMADKPEEYLSLVGYPAVWWRPAEDCSPVFWPKPQWNSTSRPPIMTILYFENGDPAGFILQ
jgi:hypothetical protein